MIPLESAKKFLLECRPLFVASTVDPCYKESGRERARRELADLEDSTPKGRGLAGRVRRFAESLWCEDYRVQGVAK